MVRSMMSQTTLPKSFWYYALETAARILNMVPTKKIKVLVARNVEFLENSLINQEASGSLEDLEIIQEEDTHPSIDTSLNHKEDDLEKDEPQIDIIPIRRSTRTRCHTDRMCVYIDDEEHELGDLGEPANYKAALLDLESDKWLNAMNVETESIKDNKGYTQTPRIDYEETFSPVADIRAIRILIDITAFYDYEIWQMYVKTAFLNGYLNEGVYMEQPKVLQDVKSYLGRRFAIKDLGEAAYILGIKIYRDRLQRLISLCQSAYIEKILKRYHIKNSKRGSIPMQEKLRLSKSQGASTPAELKRMQNVPYASAKGSIMYAVRCTRPDVVFAQNTGYVFVLNGGVVDCKSAKQSIFATSSAEAEYIAALMLPKKPCGLENSFLGLESLKVLDISMPKFTTFVKLLNMVTYS
nr:hypothetical protein [Tanacetum cinerariifolium]